MTIARIDLRTGDGWVLPLEAPVAEGAPPTAPLESTEQLRVEVGDAHDGTLTLYDTWEWNLWHKGLLLIGDGTTLRVLKRDQPDTPLGWVKTQTPERFAEQQPPGPLADIVAPHLGLRALLPVATLDVHQRRWAVRNEDDKIVVRLLEQIWQGQLRTLQLLPLRGYNREAKRIRKTLPGAGRHDQHPLLLAIGAAAITPRRWTNKPPFTFDPKTPAHAATLQMLSAMLSLARRTEAGLINDLDTEFLHDYRVLLRKARSVLSLTKNVIAPEATAALKTRLKAIAQRTNTLRDLDVHLMERDAQMARIPLQLQPGLAPLFDDLQQRRTETHQALVKVLQSEEYQTTLADLQEQVYRAPPGPKAMTRIRKLADKKLTKQLGGVLAQGRAITPATPDEEVHELRIDCKKLRYLLEFYQHLYPPGELKPMVKQLKKLQSVLGTFNDRSVQQQALYDWLEETPNIEQRTAISVGALLGALATEQKAARDQVRAVFDAFDTPRLRARFLAMTGHQLAEAA